MCLFSASDGDGGAAAARAAEEARQARIRQGTTDVNKTFAGFDDSFYKGITDAYTGYYLPQLEKQYQDARKALVLRLGQQGILNSSPGIKYLQDIDTEAANQRGLIGDQAVSAAAKARGDVEDARAQLLAQLSASADPTAVAVSAAERAKALSAPPAFDPMVNLFTNFAGIADSQIRGSAARAGAAQPFSPGDTARRRKSEMVVYS